MPCAASHNKYFLIENVNLDEIPDETDRRRVEAMINNFGQTPTKLFSVRQQLQQRCD